MRWQGDEQSNNVEDRRGGGGGGGFGIGGGTVGIGTIVIALIGSWFFGVSPSTILSLLSGGSPAQVQQAPSHPPANDQETQFVRTVLRYTETTWTQIFKANGATYTPPILVLYDGRTPTQGCGTGQAAVGPFYCPADRKVYIDLTFFRMMQQRFHVGGEFTQAYVIAHEVGHHVQNLLGISGKVDSMRQRLSETEANALSVRVELQADCFAGVWAYHTNEAKQIIEQGDVESALKAASAIGDDALQRQSRGEVVPDSFTHGTSAQRVRWFTKGLQTGSVEQCNTFEARQL
ncbi:metalloprotease [Massilia sp. WF1]|uniref:KPN_02809 family neutral zinc metallopeptidase n=1 Tax=unclassified Massilia TaxID=2609279 RepID=UPI00064A28E5|nr:MULTISPECIES: neutral zinc metallopeptidase [unclassified Massilia]ALK96629.1 metalloprotease [Massilia sp. WG5]KLU35355.1 metalloprotease [Massilia sp. WF1]